MSNYEHKDGSGSLWVNDKKQADNQPDYKGSAKVNGKDVEMSGWKKVTQSGKTFLSLAIGEPYKKEEPKVEPKKEADLPF